MKKAVLVSFFLILAGLASYVGYQAWQTYQQENAWSYIPDHAVAIFECQKSITWLKENQSKPAWQTLTKLPYFRTVLQRLDELQSMDEDVSAFLNSRPITASLHVTEVDDFDYLFFVPTPSLADREQLAKTLKHFSHNPGYTISTRSFQSFTITEIRPIHSRDFIFSYIIHHQHFIGSYTPFLVEDAIRTIRNTTLLANPRWENAHQQPNLGSRNSSKLSVYIHPKALPHLAKLLATNELGNSLSGLSYAAQSANFLTRIEKDGIHLAGSIYPVQNESQMDFLEIFRNQPASASQMTSLLSDKTAIWYRWSFEDAQRLRDALHHYFSQHEPATIKLQAAMREAYQIRSEAVFDWLDREIGLSIVENGEPEPTRLLFVQAKEVDKAISQLSGLSAAVDRKNDEAPYLEEYAQVPIREIRVPDFPAKVFGNMFSGFRSCFYAPIKHYIVFSTSISGLKTLLDEQATGTSFSWVSKQQHFSNPKANFSLFIRTNRAWNYLYQSSSAHWKTILLQNTAQLKEFETLSLQITQGTTAYQADIWLRHTNNQPSTAKQGQFVVSSTTSFGQAVGSQSSITINSEDKSIEILIQDKNDVLYLLDKKAKIIWKKPLGSPIIASAEQIDYDKNNKSYYLVTTSAQIHLLDREGQEAGNFPIMLPDSSTLHTVSVLDYDKSKEYRILVSNTKGYLYMFDKKGKLLEGWNPLKLDYWLSSTARHLRIRDKDYIAAIQENGKVQVLNRRGLSYEGFPISFKTKVSSPLFINEGSTANQTLLTAVTDYGEIIQFDLLGKIQRKEQLYRSSKNAVFAICIEEQRKDWVIIQRVNDKISILNKQGTTLFEKEVPSSEKILVQYQAFGNDIQVFSFTSPTHEKTSLYDINGKIIGNKPIENAFPLVMTYSESFNKLFIYRASKHNAGVWTLKLR